MEEEGKKGRKERDKLALGLEFLNSKLDQRSGECLLWYQWIFPPFELEDGYHSQNCI